MANASDVQAANDFLAPFVDMPQAASGSLTVSPVATVPQAASLFGPNRLPFYILMGAAGIGLLLLMTSRR